MVDTLTSSAVPDTENLKRFWQEVPFFGSQIEEYLSRFWYVLLLVPCVALIVCGFWLDKDQSIRYSLRSVTIVLRDPYLSSLLVALFLSAIAFSIWRSTIRQTFSTAFETGIISDTPESIQNFLSVSSRFRGLVRSPLRFIPIVGMIVATLIANEWAVKQIPVLSSPDLVLNIMMLIFIAAFSYAVGAVAWCFVSTARWIASLSRQGMLRIQPGHSDGCCGLQGVGNCCLQSAVPLLIGMVLCLIWGNSRNLPTFNRFEFLSRTIVPFASILLVVLFALACALVFLPVQGLHARLKAHRQAREREFTGALETELSRVDEALAAEDHTRVRNLADRIKLVQMLDPVKLKLATWPFNSASLLKYGVTPLASLAVSLGKDVVKNLIP
jgi:hypothetical protein